MSVGLIAGVAQRPPNDSRRAWRQQRQRGAQVRRLRKAAGRVAVP